jgi:hypothetical protein
MYLLPSQKLLFPRTIAEEGFQPTEFEIKFEGENNKQFSVKYNNIYWFVFSYEGNQMTNKYSPAEKKKAHAISLPPSEHDVEKTINNLKTWLKLLRRELNAELELDKILNPKFNFDDEYFNSEELFNEEDKREIKNRINLLKSEMKTVLQLPEQIEEMNRKLDLIASRLDIMSKNEWRGYAIGIIISLLIQWGVTHEQGVAIWNTLVNAFSFVKALAQAIP